MGPVSSQSLHPGSVLSSTSLGMATSMENLAHIEPDFMGPNRNHEVLTEADFHTKGELTCCEEV